MIKKPLKVMIFGVFDGLHQGHHFFIEQAQKYGNKLLIVVTPDEMVLHMKDKKPKNTLFDRVKQIEKEFKNIEVIIGDKKLYSWNVIKINKPNIIVLGYDQRDLKRTLDNIKYDYGFKIIVIKKNHEGNKLHSSLLRKK